MEVKSSDAPESVIQSSSPEHNAPEVYSSNAPEALHRPQDYPPEIAPGSGIETNYDGLEHVVLSKEVESLPTPPKFSKATKLWAGIAIALVVVAAVIGGAVGGTLERHKSKSVHINP